MNILVSENFNCKITDFGMSKLITDDLELFNTANAGTPLWMAPEVKAGVYGFPADVYSTGLVIYEILEEKLPVWDKTVDRVILPENFYFKSVVLPLTCNEASERLNAKQALEHYDTILVDSLIEKIATELGPSVDVPPKPTTQLDDYLQFIYNLIPQQKYDINNFLPNLK